ncbi:helix-turn-helix transcriptional regulator [Bilophila wadsworthia]|uniref:helix-turn-helix transcriptional regulator n=1 Tax=Bilophila wadsworthia TaxID=35833 RepID=UPI00242C3D5A|nr:helix-turn-helix transcriptional regulator [Bilophila wadsworthia]
MQAELRFHPCEARQAVLDIKEGQEVISLTVPTGKARAVADAIRSVLSLAGHKVRRVNANGEEIVSADEVFPNANPAMMLRGLRGKEDITQAELAERLGISQNMVSDMESGKRNISVNMAKRIGETFHVPYKLFL